MKDDRSLKMFMKIWRDPPTRWGALAIAFFLFVAAFGPSMAPYPYDLQDPSALLQAPSLKHPMGTDRLGRDLFSRLIYGTRISITVSLLTAFSALLFGTIYGGVSGYVGGKTDDMMMRWVDVVYALPDIPLVILMTLLFGRGYLGIFLALSLVSWVTVARLIRGEVLRLREFAYVEAARAVGAGHARILFAHLLPNTLGVLLVTLTFRIPTVILAESTLGFIGLGLAPPAASWGILANEGWSAMKFYPHLILFPSLAIFTAMMAFHLFGDGLRDVLLKRTPSAAE